MTLRSFGTLDGVGFHPIIIFLSALSVFHFCLDAKVEQKIKAKNKCSAVFAQGRRTTVFHYMFQSFTASFILRT